MLNSVRLRNFKLHEDTKIDTPPVTVFIGPNNSGKSSIFQAVLALRQAVSRGQTPVFLQPAQRQPPSADQPYLVPGADVIDLGEFHDVLRQGSQAIEIGFSGTLVPQSPHAYAIGLSLDVAVLIQDNSLHTHTGNLRTDYGEISWDLEKGGSRQKDLEGILVKGGLPVQTGLELRIEDSSLVFGLLDNFQLLVAKPQYPPDVPQAKRAQIDEHSKYLADSPRLVLNALHPVPPLRGFEEGGYPITFTVPQYLDMLTLPDRAVALTNLLAGDRQLRARVSQRLSELLGIGIDFETVVGKRLKIWATHPTNGSPGTLFANEGTGANQLPFVLVPIALAKPGDTILLSEPEAHLHPKMQSQLSIALLKMERALDLQLFIETHSEHVLHALLHAVGAGDLRPDDLAIYYFQNVDGTAKVERLEVNRYGQVKGGLPGFFDQSLTELSNYLDALRKA